jgi:vacuolar-type H+-ATPase subunit E/Vma4
MDGLDKLLEGIVAETTSRIEGLHAEAKSYAESQRAEAFSRKESILAEVRTRAEQDAKALVARGESQVESARRRAKLASRQADVDLLLDEAVRQLTSDTPENRASLYADLIGKKELEPGEIVLGKDDADVGFLLLQKLPEGFTLAAEAGAFAGGFVVRRGSVEDNVTLDLVLKNYRPQLAAFAATLSREK